MKRQEEIGAVKEKIIPAAVFIGGILLFISTLAPATVFGDPTEYTLMPHLWAILHPPGYAFMTLLVKFWQTLVPVGTLAYRTNLLSAFAGAAAGVIVYRVVRLTPLSPSPDGRSIRQQKGEGLGVGGEVWAAVLAATSLYTASNFWQHSLHTNAHIVTAMLASLSILLLLCWRQRREDRWLYAFGFVAGLSVTHHPLLVFGFPAYAVFILSQFFNRLVVRVSARKSEAPTAAVHWRSLLIMAACGVLGLFPWLYFPIRSSIQPPPPFGLSNMNTLDGFLNLVLARGLTNVNLFHFGLEEQWHRLLVFWSLLQLQFAWPLVVLAVIGLVWLIRRDWRASLLLGLHALVNLAFIMNSVQDVMAYLLVPLVSTAMLIGAGALALNELFQRPQTPVVFKSLGLSALLIFPLANAFWLAPRISLHDLRAADAYVDSVFEHFAGKRMGAVLLSDWEHATPLWYRQYVDGQTLDPADVTVVYVNKPFAEAVWESIDKGPLYLLDYNRDIVTLGFRLRAEGMFYRLLPPTTELPPIAHPLTQTFGPIQMLGYEVLTDAVEAGDVIPIILYLRARAVTDHVIHPFATLGLWEYRFTTDSHWLTPYWQANEIIAERWEVVVPLLAPAGDYPLSVGLSNLTTGEDFEAKVSLGTVSVRQSSAAQVTANANTLTKLVANFGQRIGVESVTGWGGGSPLKTAPWVEPIQVHPGGSVELRVQWRALARIENSYTVFAHLLDSENQLIASQDYTPLGGAFPTMLWFPKWLPDQTVVDPYTLTVPSEAAPGDYYIEIGLYGLRSVVRVPAFDRAGNLAGDRFVVGGVTVGP